MTFQRRNCFSLLKEMEVELVKDIDVSCIRGVEHLGDNIYFIFLFNFLSLLQCSSVLNTLAAKRFQFILNVYGNT